VGGLPRQGFRDLARRLRIAWLWFARVRVRRALLEAEGELGWLGWEQVDFFDNQIVVEVEKVREFENTQASLMNTSAELSGRKAALDEELAAGKAVHDEAQDALSKARHEMLKELEQSEARRRQKLEAVERFERALEEIARLEEGLEVRSVSLMKIERPDMEIRAEAREVSDALGRLPGERRLVLADKAAAGEEAARLEPGITQLRLGLQQNEDAASAARERLAAATRRVTAEMRLLERQRKKSNVHMSQLDREKRKPYRLIGACLADHGIAPLNQPQMLENVLTLRERHAVLAQMLSDLQVACRAVDSGVLIGFYLLLVAVLFTITVIAAQFIHR